MGKLKNYFDLLYCFVSDLPNWPNFPLSTLTCNKNLTYLSVSNKMMKSKSFQLLRVPLFKEVIILFVTSHYRIPPTNASVKILNTSIWGYCRYYQMNVKLLKFDIHTQMLLHVWASQLSLTVNIYYYGFHTFSLCKAHHSFVSWNQVKDLLLTTDYNDIICYWPHIKCQDGWINWPSCIFMAQDKVDLG